MLNDQACSEDGRAESNHANAEKSESTLFWFFSQRAEADAVVAAAFEKVLEREGLFVVEGGAELVEFALEAVEGAEDFLAILEGDGFPEGGVAGGDAGGVAQAGAGEVNPVGVAGAEVGAIGGGEKVRQVADVGGDFVVGLGRGGGDFQAEGFPEAGDALDIGGGGVDERSDEAGAALEEFGVGVFEAGFFGAGHGVGADEGDFFRERGASVAANEGLGGADIGDESAGTQARRDLGEERDDGVNGSAGDDEVGFGDGVTGVGKDGVAPGLGFALEAGLGTAGPDGGVTAEAAALRGLKERGAKEAGAEDGNAVEQGGKQNGRWKMKDGREEPLKR
jgi:hypothetical protein